VVAAAEGAPAAGDFLTTQTTQEIT
jgi:hypothetical protein